MNILWIIAFFSFSEPQNATKMRSCLVPCYTYTTIISLGDLGREYLFYSISISSTTSMTFSIWIQYIQQIQQKSIWTMYKIVLWSLSICWPCTWCSCTMKFDLKSHMKTVLRIYQWVKGDIILHKSNELKESLLFKDN